MTRQLHQQSIMSAKKRSRLRSREWFDIPGDPSATALHLERYTNFGIKVEELRSGKPIIGIAQTGSDLVPCNRIHLNLAQRVRDGIREAGGIAIEFPVHPVQESGKRPTAALDRNLQYLSLVEILFGYPLDGVVLTIGCDKTTPALLMAAATVDIPSICLSSGPMMNGYWRGERWGSGTIVWKARKLLAAGEIDEEEFIQLVVDSVEADDVIAYVAKQLLPKSKSIIMSTDKDFLQLVNDRISVWSPTKKKLYKPDVVKEEYGVTSKNLLMTRIFDGDASDNIKGVMGIGSKTLLKNFPDLADEGVTYTVDEIVDKCEQGSRFHNVVRKQRDRMHLNHKLMQLHEVDISGGAKLKINRVVNGKIQELVKSKFQTMFIEDRMFGALPNLDSWIMTVWTKLNRLAKINNGS